MTSGARTAAFAAAAVPLMAVAVLLSASGPPAPRRHQPRPGPPTRIEGHQDPLPARDHLPPLGGARSPASASSARGTVGHEREPPNAPAVAPSEQRSAATAAATFLHGYLAYSYGAPSADIRGAAAALAEALRATPPRVPPAVARARPRVISIRARATPAARIVDVVAAIDDGQRRYDVPLEVRRVGAKWVVSRIDG